MIHWRRYVVAAAMMSRMALTTRGAAFAVLAWAGAAQAQTPAPAATPGAVAPSKDPFVAADAAESKEAAQDDILVTAHRQHGAVATQVPPEASINSAAISALGATDLKEVFETLGPEISDGRADPGQPAAGAIVLVNGQRIAGFDSIKDLPPEAIRRVEIFPAKVALEYGYGPDQKVVNVVLRSRYRALTLVGRDTLAPDNWRGIYRAKVDLLRIGENSHWNLDLDYSHLDPIFAPTTLAAPSADPGQTPPAHTLATQSDDLTISGAVNRPVGAVSAELAGRLELAALQSRPGLSQEDGALLAEEGLTGLGTGPRQRRDSTADAQSSLTLNGRLDGWRWSFIGRLEESSRLTQTADATRDKGLAPVLLPSPGLLGRTCDANHGPAENEECVSTDFRTASGDFYLNGDLGTLPAGAVTAALRTGFAFSGVRSDSSSAPEHRRSRDEGDAQANIDLPLTARFSPIGKLSIGFNGAEHRLSDMGSLSTLGSTLDWSPVTPVQILASISSEEQAPSLLQLGEAALDTPDQRAYDFVRGNTAIIDLTEGGNPDLIPQRARIGDVRLQVTPVRGADLTLSAEYRIERTRNPIVDLSAATSAAMAAFPERFTRSSGGYLTAMDAGPVNAARRDLQQIRWGLFYSTAFGAPAKSGNRDQFQIGLYDTWRLQDEVVLRAGLPALDLLHGDILGDKGGTPEHRLELQSTIATDAWGLDVNAAWQTPTRFDGGLAATQRLTFSQGVTLNLRLQINLADQHWLTRLFPRLKGRLNLSAENLLGAHLRVHDATGGVPLSYAESYLNPTGRTFRITLRKRFHG
jgi:hypothetical protein